MLARLAEVIPDTSAEHRACPTREPGAVAAVVRDPGASGQMCEDNKGQKLVRGTLALVPRYARTPMGWGLAGGTRVPVLGCARTSRGQARDQTGSDFAQGFSQ